MELDELINPKKTVYRRLEQAEHGTPTPTAKQEAAEPEHADTKPFGKKWTEQERAEHQAALAKLLKARQ